MTKENKRKIRIIFWIAAIIVAGFIGVTCGIIGITKQNFYIVLVIYVILLWITMFVINMVYVKNLMRQVNLLLPILNEEGNPDRYLKELTELIGDARSPGFKSVFCINSAVAYCNKGEYENARIAMEKINPLSVPRINRPVYYLNMTGICIHLDEYDKAMEIYNANKDDFISMSNREETAPYYQFIYIAFLIHEGKTDEAGRELELAKKKWTEPRAIKEFEYLEKKLK